MKLVLVHDDPHHHCVFHVEVTSWFVRGSTAYFDGKELRLASDGRWWMCGEPWDRWAVDPPAGWGW